MAAQVHQTAAFGVDRSPALGELPYGDSYRVIARELFGIELRIATTDIDRIGSVGKHPVGQWTERHDLGTGRPQAVEIVLVVETESSIARNSDTHLRAGDRRFHLRGPVLVQGDRDLQYAVEFDELLHEQRQMLERGVRQHLFI